MSDVKFQPRLDARLLDITEALVEALDDIANAVRVAEELQEASVVRAAVVPTNILRSILGEAMERLRDPPA